MKWLWGIQTIGNILEIAGIYGLLSLWDSLGGKSLGKKLLCVLGMVVTFGLSIVQRSDCLYSRMWVLFCIIVTFLFCCFIYRLPRAYMCCLIAIYFETIGCLDLFWMMLPALLTKSVGRIPQINLQMGLERMIAFVASRMLMAVLAVVMVWRRDKMKRWLIAVGKRIYWVPIAEHISLYYAGDIVRPAWAWEAARNWFVVLVLDFIFLLWLLTATIRQEGKRLRRQKDEEQLVYQRARRAEKEIYQKKDRYYHDMKHYLLTMQGIARKGELEVLQAYLEQIMEPLYERQAKIVCADPVLDYMFRMKRQLAEEKGVEINLEIRGVSEQTDVEWNLDLCTLIGNLLDNAIEGCEKATDKRWLSFLMEQKPEGFYLRIQNSCRKMVEELWKTQKEESWKHGIGRNSIDFYVEKYKGTWDWSCKEGIFTVVVALCRERGNYGSGVKSEAGCR